MKSKSKTNGFVWAKHSISACTKKTRLTSQGLKLLTISLVVLFPAAVAFAQTVSFSPATDFLVSSLHPASVAIADLNGDGKSDLAVANVFSDSVSILLGTGAGGFGAATTFRVGTRPTSVAIADLNGDGKADLAVANQGGSSVSILLGNGTGSFGAATNFPAGIRPISVAIGDLNADGKPDLAVANSYSTSNKVSILLGTGGGGFLPATNFAVGTSPIFVAIGDLNGDGKPDLAVANNSSNNVSILLGTGTGAFGTATNFPAGLLPASLAIADLNGDRKPDLAVVTRNDVISILLGDGTGAFGAAKDFAVGTHPLSVAIGDLNGDGKPDLAVTNRAANSVSILLNTLTCAPGGPFVVNSTAGVVDAAPGNGCCATAAGVCTLRAAIQEANALTGADTITLPAGTYTLSIPGVNEDYSATGDLDITSNLTITGAGANITTIDGGGIDRVLEVRWENKPNVSISGLTVTGGKTLSTQPGGGSGGGMLTQGALLTLTKIAVSGNTAGNQGGGIFKAGPLTLNSCTVSNNTAGYEPGTPGGGGIMAYINGTLTLNNTTISGNSSPFGGGIGSSNYSLDISMTNSTVSNNTGGGLRVRAGTVTMKNIIMANGSFNCSFYGVGSSVLNSLGHNLSTDNSCTSNSIVIPGIVSGGLNQPTDLNNTPAQLAPLALNLPGSTKTHALLPGSPAIDKGGDCLAVDQRGVPRPQGAGCDIGAYEVGSGPPAAACATLPPNMVAWWPMDETSGTTVTDIVGGHNGTARPASIGAFAGPGPVTSSLWPPPTLPVGMVNNSLFFRGDRRVEIPSHADLEPGTGDFTIDAWVNYAASGNGQFLTVARKALGNGGTQTTAPLGLIGYEMVIQDYSPGKGILSFTMQGAGQGNLGTGGPYITPNTWHHVVFTLQRTSTAATTTIYLDGSSIGSTLTTPWTYGNISNTWNLLIGGDGVLAGNIAVDEVEIFKRALSQSEIQAIFNAGSAGKCNCVTPPSGLVSWWPGDGNANDIKDGNTGTLVGAVSYAPGKVNQAFSFPSLTSSGSDRVGLTSAPSANTFTIEAWVFANQHGPSGYRTIYADNFRGFWLENGKLNWWRGGDRFVGNTTVPLGAWHHIALTYSQGTFTGYLNGAADGTSLFLGESLPTGTGLGIGGHSNFVPEDFDGLIDELRIYDRALDPAEILAIFNAGSAGKCKTVVSPNKPPVANAGPDQTVEAASPSGASVTLNGSGSSDPDSNPLTYNWTGPFVTASAVSPTITLSLGTHTVTLKVGDGQATATDTVSITVRDTTPPDTIINSVVDGNGTAVASGGSTLSGSITFTFGGTDAVGVTGFQCGLDGAAYGPCTSPASYSALAIGSHTFQVWALDAAVNVDASPASFTWTVITPAQAIENLITTINNMGLAGGVATSLTAPLNNINTNNKAAACGKLNAFINQVNTKLQNGQLTSAQASQLLQAASAIKENLSC